MKCITVKQPWAELIVCGIKDVENRTWSTNYHGPLLIHASKQYDVAGEHWLRENASRLRDARHPSMVGGLAPNILGKVSAPRGCIVGVVDLVICTRDRNSDWHEPGMVGWYLRNPEKLERPVPFRGALGLFDVPEDFVRKYLKEIA